MTDTEKWKDPFLRALEAPYKVLFFYLKDDCDHAGIWTPDWDVAQLKIGQKLDIETAKKKLAPRVIFLQNGRWFVPEFLEEQYGELNEQNRVHASVLQKLIKNGIDPKNKPLPSPLQGAKDKDMDKDMDFKIKKESPKKSEPGVSAEIVFPYDSPEFRAMWDNWVTYRKQSGKPYRSDLSLQAALKKLATWPEETAIQVMEQSIANGWQGLFAINQQSNGKQLTARDQKELDRKISIANHFAKRFGSDSPARGNG